jgi:transmembrane sensor
MQPVQLNLFFQKFAVGVHTEAEHQQFMDWLKNASIPEIETALEEYKILIGKNHIAAKKTDLNLMRDIEAALDQYELASIKKIKVPKVIRFRVLLRIAACLILFVAGATVYFSVKKSNPHEITVVPAQKVQQDALPGRNKAILTLADGSAMMLIMAR